MAHYRLYFLDANGHITRGLDLDCRDDSAAIEKAGTFEVAHGMELWRGKVRVKIFKARG